MSYIIPSSGAPIYFDLTISEMHQGSLEITSKPVERGSPITDNARQTLDSVTLVVFVTSSPSRDRDDNSLGGRTVSVDLDVPSPPPNPSLSAAVSAVGSAIVGLFSDSAGPVRANAVLQFAKVFDARQDAEAALRMLQRDKLLCQVVTSFRSYTDMILESFDMPVDEDSGDGAEITLNFRQIRIVDSRLVNAPVAAQARGQKAKDKGHKDTKTPPPKKGSLLLAAAQGAGIPIPGALP